MKEMVHLVALPSECDEYKHVILNTMLLYKDKYAVLLSYF